MEQSELPFLLKRAGFCPRFVHPRLEGNRILEIARSTPRVPYKYPTNGPLLRHCSIARRRRRRRGWTRVWQSSLERILKAYCFIILDIKTRIATDRINRFIPWYKRDDVAFHDKISIIFVFSFNLLRISFRVYVISVEYFYLDSILRNDQEERKTV